MNGIMIACSPFVLTWSDIVHMYVTSLVAGWHATFVHLIIGSANNLIRGDIVAKLPLYAAHMITAFWLNWDNFLSAVLFSAIIGYVQIPTQNFLCDWLSKNTPLLEVQKAAHDRMPNVTDFVFSDLYFRFAFALSSYLFFAHDLAYYQAAIPLALVMIERLYKYADSNLIKPPSFDKCVESVIEQLINEARANGDQEVKANSGRIAELVGRQKNKWQMFGKFNIARMINAAKERCQRAKKKARQQAESGEIRVNLRPKLTTTSEGEIPFSNLRELQDSVSAFALDPTSNNPSVLVSPEPEAAQDGILLACALFHRCMLLLFSFPTTDTALKAIESDLRLVRLMGKLPQEVRQYVMHMKALCQGGRGREDKMRESLKKLRGYIEKNGGSLPGNCQHEDHHHHQHHHNVHLSSCTLRTSCKTCTHHSGTTEAVIVRKENGN